MTRGVKRAAAKALTAASIAPAPRPETKPPARIAGHHGVAAQAAALAGPRARSSPRAAVPRRAARGPRRR